MSSPQESDELAESDRTLLRRIRAGADQDAALDLYLRYARRLLQLTRQKTPSDLATRLDPEDIVQSVFRTFFRRASAGQYDVPEGEELWKLLLVITLNKVKRKGAYHRADKRDVQRTQPHQQAELNAKIDGDEALAYQFLQMSVDEVIAHLPPASQMIVRLRIEGYEMAEIAHRVTRSKRTVERVLQSFRARMLEELEEPQ